MTWEQQALWQLLLVSNQLVVDILWPKIITDKETLNPLVCFFNFLLDTIWKCLQ